VAQMFFIQVDHLNTPRLMSDGSQNTVWRNDQTEPFGDSVPNGDPGNTGHAFDFPMRASRYYQDKETGLLYSYLRDCYDPVLGRFCEPDPIGLDGGLSLYAYVNGNPLRYIDPRGLQGVATIPEAAAVIGIGCLFTPGCRQAVNSALNPPKKEEDDPLSGSGSTSSSSSASSPAGVTPDDCYVAYEQTIETVCKKLKTKNAKRQCYENAMVVYQDCLRQCKKK
jgi:RHS repeat-associated protein